MSDGECNINVRRSFCVFVEVVEVSLGYVVAMVTDGRWQHFYYTNQTHRNL